jgi:hypothetical protein
MPNIPEHKNQRLFLIWEHYDIMNKTFSSLFLKKAWKPLNFTQIIAPEKVCPSVEQNEIDILYIDKRWKIYLKMNLLDTWAACFLKGKPHEFARFFNEIKIFANSCQLHYFLV